MQKTLMQGNIALAESAILSDCRFYAGYPITPQNEIPEYLSTRMFEVGGVFIQAESEISAINMIYGASACSVRAMTTSSSPGISLMQEGISFLVSAELPAVIVNIQRGGPGLGNISAGQGDYFQATKGGGHGDYKIPVYAPFNVQEMWDLTNIAFDRADKYRIPVMILSDAVIGQMTEPIIKKSFKVKKYDKDWSFASHRTHNWSPRIIKTLRTGDGELEKFNISLQNKIKEIEENEILFQGHFTDDAKILVVAFGISARIALSSVKQLRNEGFKVGLLRPITLFPFPSKVINSFAQHKINFLVIELNMGQMLEDVKIAVDGKSNVWFYGRPSGALFTTTDIYDEIRKYL